MGLLIKEPIMTPEEYGKRNGFQKTKGENFKNYRKSIAETMKQTHRADKYDEEIFEKIKREGIIELWVDYQWSWSKIGAVLSITEDDIYLAVRNKIRQQNTDLRILKQKVETYESQKNLQQNNENIHSAAGSSPPGSTSGISDHGGQD